jgi:DNA-binding response OmpR family regulator
MLRILMVTFRADAVRAFIDGFSSDPGVCLDLVASAAEAVKYVGTDCPHLVIIDSGLEDSDSLDLVRRLIMVNAMVNTAVISSLPEDEFHDKSEGLGILCRLAARPTGNDSAALLQKLRAVVGAAG